MTVEQLNARLLAVVSQLDQASAEIRGVPLFPEGENLRHIGTALAEIFEVMRAIHAIRADLMPAQLHETQAGREANARLTTLLSDVSRLVGGKKIPDALNLLKAYVDSEVPDLHRSIATHEIQRISHARPDDVGLDQKPTRTD